MFGEQPRHAAPHVFALCRGCYGWVCGMVTVQQRGSRFHEEHPMSSCSLHHCCCYTNVFDEQRLMTSQRTLSLHCHCLGVAEDEEHWPDLASRSSHAHYLDDVPSPTTEQVVDNPLIIEHFHGLDEAQRLPLNQEVVDIRWAAFGQQIVSDEVCDGLLESQEIVDGDLACKPDSRLH